MTPRCRAKSGGRATKTANPEGATARDSRSSAPSRAGCLQNATMDWRCEVGSAAPRWALGWRLPLRLDISDATHICQTMLLPRGMPSRRRVCDTAHSNLYRLLIKQTSGRSELSWAGRPPNSHSRVPRNSMRRSSQDQGLGVPGSKVLSGLHNLPGTRLAQHGNPCCAPTHQLGCGRAPGASAVGWNGGLRHRWRWCSEPARLASLALDMALIDKARHEANTQGFGKEQRQGRPALLYVHSSQPLVHPCVA